MAAGICSPDENGRTDFASGSEKKFWCPALRHFFTGRIHPKGLEMDEDLLFPNEKYLWAFRGPF